MRASDAPATASNPKDMLTEAGQLQKQLKKPGLRVLDTRPQAEYARGHIPGAVRVDVKAWHNQGRKKDGFHDAKAWTSLIAPLGINRDSQVVVYGKSLTDTARVWWTLKYLGVPNVAILDGGWQVWVKEKLPADAAVPKIDAREFEPRFQADRLEEMESLKKSLGNGKTTVVDTRTREEFSGKNASDKKGGHIPGAKHLEWKELIARDGRFKSAAELKALFRQRGIDPGQTAVTC
jgi:thiosulfate/3-mercaptopyruvate sulfurtransferase